MPKDLPRIYTKETFPKCVGEGKCRRKNTEKTLPKSVEKGKSGRIDTEETFPKFVCEGRSHRIDSDETFQKLVADGKSCRSRSNRSDSGLNSTSTTCSVLSDSSSEFSERAGSILPFQPRDVPHITGRCISGCDQNELRSESPLQLNRATPSLSQPVRTALPHSQPVRTALPHSQPVRSHSSSRHQRCHKGSQPSPNGNTRHGHTSRSPPFLQRRCLIIITIISLSTSILSCCFTTLCFVYNFVPAQEDNTFMDGDYETCIPYSHIQGHDEHTNSMRDELFIKTVKGEKVCCARNSGQMSSLIQIIMNKQKNRTVPRSTAKHSFRPSPASAHKYLSPWSISGNDKDVPQCDGNCQLKMRPGNDYDREHARGVIVRNNGLQIHQDGWYYIYSSIHIDSQSACKLLSNQVFSHYIMRDRPNSQQGSGNLAESVHKCCDTCTNDHHTSYIAGLFEMKKDDVINLKVSNSSLVLYTGNSSFLGLVLLHDSTAKPPTT